MKHARAFNFIYNGFIGDRDVNLRHVSPLGELKSILKEFNISIDGREAIGTNRYMALMSVDLLHRFSVHSTADYQKSKPWPMQYNYLYYMGHSKKAASQSFLKRLIFDVEQINEIYAYYEHLDLLNGDIAEWIKFTDLNDKVYGLCENVEQKNKVFTKCFVDLINNLLINKSYELPPVFKSQSYSYINYAIAINLMSSINSQSFIKDFGININKKHALSFYLMLIKNDLISKDVSAIYDRLQAFIDLFIFGAYKYDEELKARRLFIEEVVNVTLKKCACMKVKGVHKKISSLSDYGDELLDYMTKIPFKKYEGKEWYKDIYELAIKKEQYSSFMIAMLSFMPKNSDLNEMLNKAGNALKERVNKRGYSGDRRILNVKVDSEIFNMLDDIQSEFGLNRLDAVMKAIRETHDAYFKKARAEGPSFGVKHDQINTNQINEKQKSNSRKRAGSKRTSAWSDTQSSSNNSTQDTQHDSVSSPGLDIHQIKVKENGISTAPLEEHQSHQSPSEQTTSGESDVIEDKEVDEAASPRSTASIGLQTLAKNLG